MVVTGISPTAARVETAVRELAASGGDIFQATSIVLAIVGAGGRAVVAEVADDLRPQLADAPDDPVLRRAMFLLEEMLCLRDTTTITLELPAEAADAGDRFLELLDEADEYCRAEPALQDLLSSPAVAAFRKWFMGEIVRQLRQIT